MSGRLLTSVASIALFAVPLGLSVWALLDAAHRPAWAWALAERRQVAWLAAICVGVLFVVPGLVAAGLYLGRVRPRLAAVERGEL